MGKVECLTSPFSSKKNYEYGCLHGQSGCVFLLRRNVKSSSSNATMYARFTRSLKFAADNDDKEHMCF